MFAANLKRVRKARGLTQEKLAEAASLHINYVSSVERGERNVSLRNIERLADALNVTMASLVTRPSTRLGEDPDDTDEILDFRSF